MRGSSDHGGAADGGAADGASFWAGPGSYWRLKGLFRGLLRDLENSELVIFKL